MLFESLPISFAHLHAANSTIQEFEEKNERKERKNVIEKYVIKVFCTLPLTSFEAHVGWTAGGFLLSLYKKRGSTGNKRLTKNVTSN